MLHRQYPSLTEAAAAASYICDGWRFATSEETYDRQSLAGMAQASDEANPLDEDSHYVVAENGAIGFVEDEEDVEWLFLPLKGTNFCGQCGRPVNPGDRFCAACGAEIL